MAGDPGVNLIEYADREMMMIDLANSLAGELRNCLVSQERASFAVPGGTTPGPMFDALCAVTLEWERVDVIPTDERWVPATHPRSNARLVRKRLLVEKAASARLLDIYADETTPEARAAELAVQVAPELPLAVLLLGMGADGHCASLFPGADRLAEAMADDAPPLMALTAPGAEEPRITLTLPVLKRALSQHILIIGPEKRAALERAQKADPMEMPVAALLGEATVHWAE